jgi:Rad3-related DNA helicase
MGVCASHADLPQGKSLSLICAALTWLRNHKRNTYEISINNAATSFQDEPDWVVEQLLKRKRAEMADLWEEREANLRKVRAKEAMMEANERKRRRNKEPNSKEKEDNCIGDDEWLLDEEDEGLPRLLDTGSNEADANSDEDQIKVNLNPLYVGHIAISNPQNRYSIRRGRTPS